MISRVHRRNVLLRACAGEARIHETVDGRLSDLAVKRLQIGKLLLDGLHIDRVNGSQGAESTLAFLLSLVDMRQAQDMLTSFKQPVAAVEYPGDLRSSPRIASRSVGQ